MWLVRVLGGKTHSLSLCLDSVLIQDLDKKEINKRTLPSASRREQKCFMDAADLRVETEAQEVA